MPDNLKKKKADRKRISLKQTHEVKYLKKIAREQLKKLETQAGLHVWGFGITPRKERCSKAQLKRICKALLKCLEK